MSTATDQALALAASTGRDHFVNVYRPSRDEQYLCVNDYSDRGCCAIAHPDGTLERVVQGYSHAVALTQPIFESQP